MNQRRPLAEFIALCAAGGAGIGFVVGIGVFFYGLWAYGFLGLAVNLVVGALLGILNSGMIAFLYGRPHAARFRVYSILLNLTVSFVLYYAILFPVVREIQRTVMVISPIVLVVTVAAVYLSYRAQSWYTTA